MNDKTRRSTHIVRAPQGMVPNWAVALIAACLGAAAIILNAIV